MLTANVIKGGAGEDRLRGEAGSDTIEGGAGADELYGGTDGLVRTRPMVQSLSMTLQLQTPCPMQVPMRALR